MCCVQSHGSDEHGRNGKVAAIPAAPILAPLTTRGPTVAAASQVAPSPVAPSGINNSWVLPANGTGIPADLRWQTLLYYHVSMQGKVRSS